MFEAGRDAKPVVFLFSDTQIVKESFLEDINNILNSGEVPNMMETEDMERILAVRPLAKAAGKSSRATRSTPTSSSWCARTSTSCSACPRSATRSASAAACSRR